MSKKNRLKVTNSAFINLKNSNIKETSNEKKCFISLEKAIIDNPNYGLCLNKKHKYFNNKNANIGLIDLFYTLCNKTWTEIDKIPKTNKCGCERICINIILDETIKNYFKKLDQDKFIIFRFGKQQNFRACGFRKENIFYLVCIDYDFSLYSH